jgi:hypothetical protein
LNPWPRSRGALAARVGNDTASTAQIHNFDRNILGLSGLKEAGN